MKKLAFLLSVLFIVSCEGPAGPRGPQGPPGPVGQLFEVQVNFTSENGYMEFVDIPTNIEVLESDIVAVYIRWTVDEGTGLDIWRPLPTSRFFQDGQLQYAFDHTVADVRLFLTGNIDLSTLGADFTQDQIFRIAILPVDDVQNNNIDLQNMEAVMKAVGPQNIQRL